MRLPMSQVAVDVFGGGLSGRLKYKAWSDHVDERIKQLKLRDSCLYCGQKDCPSAWKREVAQEYSAKLKAS